MNLRKNIELQEDEHGLWQVIKKKVGHFLWLLAVIGLGVCALGLAVMSIVNVIVKRTTESRIITAEEFREGDHVLERLQKMDADCILVLGAGVREGGEPSLMLSDRLNTSISLYEADVCDRMLMSMFLCTRPPTVST